MTIIKLISKYEAHKLVENGCKFHDNDGISTSISRKKKYYITESYKNMQKLKKIREDCANEIKRK